MIVDDKIMHFVLFKRRTEQEVREKCKKLKYDEDKIDEIIEYLKETDYINDEVYIRKYINNAQKLKHLSKNEIRIDLIRRGIDTSIIELALEDDIVQEFEFESTTYFVNKKLKAGDDVEKVKKYLLNKGYSYSNISKAIDNYNDMQDNEDME